MSEHTPEPWYIPEEPITFRGQAELEATKTGYTHMIKLKDELCTELEAARKQEPFAYCFTDVNGRPSSLTDAPELSSPQDLRVITKLYASPVPAQPWNIITYENWNIPKLGQKVILFSNGVVQDESYTLDRGDDGYFWGREDLDECPEVKEGDAWIPWPSGPTL